MCFQRLSDPEILEAMACSEALSLAADLACQSLVISTDCAATVMNIQGNHLGASSVIIREIKRKMGDFACVQIIHEKRELNVEAHNMSKAATTLEVGRHVWWSERPDFICILPNILS